MAGTFNNWSKDAAPLKLEPDGRTWTVRLKVPLGRNQYKFVINGGTWVLDPSASGDPGWKRLHEFGSARSSGLRSPGQPDRRRYCGQRLFATRWRSRTSTTIEASPACACSSPRRSRLGPGTGQ